MDKLKLLRELLAKETDPAKKQALEDEILKEIAEQERVKAETKATADFKERLDKATAEGAKLRSQLQGMGAEISGGDKPRRPARTSSVCCPRGGPAWVTRPGVAESRGITAGCGSGPTAEGTSMMLCRSR